MDDPARDIHDLHRYGPERWSELPIGLTLAGQLAQVDRKIRGSALVVGVPEGGRHIAMERLALAALLSGDDVICVSPEAQTDPYQSCISDWLLAHATNFRTTRRILQQLLTEVDRRENVFVREGIDGSLRDCADDLRAGECLSRVTLHIDGVQHFLPDPTDPSTDILARATNFRRLMALLKYGNRFGLHVVLGLDPSELREHYSELLPQFHGRLYMTSPGQSIPAEVLDLLFPGVTAETRETTCAVQPLNGRGYGLLGSEDGELNALRVAIAHDAAQVLTKLKVPRPVKWPADSL